MNQINVLNHGFVRLVDHMGDDSSIVQAARVSYGSGTKSVNEDKGLIRYLMRNEHTSPFEMVEFKFHLKMPIFVARQHIRHRTASVNEISARYSVLPSQFFLPDPETVTTQSDHNKQMRSDAKLENANQLLEAVDEHSNDSYILYEELLKLQYPRELARAVLPVSVYTEMYWKIDLKNLLHYIKLRMHSHAQKEIQVYADAMLQLIRPIVPVAIEAFEDYVLNAVKFNHKELELLLIALDMPKLLQLSGSLSPTELRELKGKLQL